MIMNMMRFLDQLYLHHMETDLYQYKDVMFD